MSKRKRFDLRQHLGNKDIIYSPVIQDALAEFENGRFSAMIQAMQDTSTGDSGSMSSVYILFINEKTDIFYFFSHHRTLVAQLEVISEHSQYLTPLAQILIS